MQVVVSNPTKKADRDTKTGLTCRLSESRRQQDIPNYDKIKQLCQRLSQHDSKLGLTQVINVDTLSHLNSVQTRFGQCPIGSFGSYQLQITEANFTVVTSITNDQARATEIPANFPKYPSLPVDDLSGSLYIPDDIGLKEKTFLDSIKVTVIEANDIEEKTRLQSDSPVWMEQRKLRFTASNFGRIKRRKRNHDKLVQELIAQKVINSEAINHGKHYEPVALQEYENYLRKTQRPIKVIPSGLFISPKTYVLGSTPDAKVIDVSIEDKFGICEIKCPYSKMGVTPVEASL